ncbi:hypothetical protein [Luteimonas sp. MC1572]|uniref:hypothetical protein n=1 Tax=Luteimonas sp. MC1572 TaxID=2799325 RepID=UPI0018F06118|nr:hypothetical protein [Luteimonas sp. MC1572]MBJ6981664.1 hypothetical protein [Luteimonas sp. MC1572]QQO02956.1 hypothetical protein JGR64_12465 [Luteimonas sp. MC1572]
MRRNKACDSLLIVALLLMSCGPVMAASAKVAQPSLLSNPTDNPHLQVGMQAIASGLRILTVSVDVGQASDLPQRINHVHFGMSLSGWSFIAKDVLTHQGSSSTVLLTYGRRMP